jgi:hypothetical protein
MHFCLLLTSLLVTQYRLLVSSLALSASNYVAKTTASLGACTAWSDRSVTNEESFCIIDRPSITMIQPLLGIDVEEECRRITSTINLPAWDRTKPLHMLVRGWGGGKTRVLEELRRNLFADNKCVPIAITATLDTLYIPAEFTVSLTTGAGTTSEAVQKSAALAVSARMLHAVTGAPFKHILTLMRNNNLALDASPEELLSAVSSRCVDLVRSVCPAASDMVLLFDEAKYMQDALLKSYPGATDVFAPLRSSLREPGRALVISSPSPTLAGYRTTGHPIHAICFPEHLDAEEIVDKWWRVPAEPAKIRQSYRCLAATLASLPRALECAAIPIRQRSPATLVEQGTVAEVLTEALSAVQDLYARALNTFPEPQLVYQAVFGDSRTLDTDTLSYLDTSLLTNTLTDSDIAVSTVPAHIIPTINLIVLCLSAKRCTAGNHLSSLMYNRILSLIMRAVQGDSKTCTDAVQHNETAADSLQKAFFGEWLAVRLAAAAAAGQEVTLAFLLGLECVQKLPVALEATLRFNGAPVPVEHLKLNSRNCTHEEFRAHLDTFTVSAQTPFTILRCADGDAADYILVAWDPTAPGGKQIVAVDLEFDEEADPCDRQPFKSDGVGQLPGKGARYEHMKQVMDTEPFAYLLFSTHNAKQWVPNYRTEPLVFSGRAGALRFFGPAMPFYDALRTKHKPNPRTL